MSKGLPVATDVDQRFITSGSTWGSCTLRQPQPSICSGVVPVYSYQRLLYQRMEPSSSAIQASCGIASAKARRSASRSRNASSACFCVVMSRK